MYQIGSKQNQSSTQPADTATAQYLPLSCIIIQLARCATYRILVVIKKMWQYLIFRHDILTHLLVRRHQIAMTSLTC